MPAGRQGFTLLELLAAAIVVSLLTGVATISVRGHLHQARLVQTVEQIAALDHRARDEARRLATPLRLRFDGGRGLISLSVGDAEKVEDPTRVIRVPRGIEITEVRVGRQRGGRQPVAVTVSPGGQSPTYGVRLTAANRATRWLVTLGMTGQQIETNEEAEVHALLSL